MIDGKAVSKEEAIKILQSKAVEEPPVAKAEDILENNAAAKLRAYRLPPVLKPNPAS